jgi:hypothetical protein
MGLVSARHNILLLVGLFLACSGGETGILTDTGDPGLVTDLAGEVQSDSITPDQTVNLDQGQADAISDVLDVLAADLTSDGGADSGDGDALSSDLVDAGDPNPDPPGTWRSALYPKDWTPEFEDEAGRFLHDFSYAGYMNGAQAVGAPGDALIVDAVLAHGADPSGDSDSGVAIQGAIDEVSAAGGGVVWLPEGLYRVDGQLRVETSHVVLRGAGTNQTRIYFTKTDGMAYQGHITIQGVVQEQNEALLVTDAPNRQDFVEVEEGADFQVGDDVHIGWVISPEFVSEHQMTGTWQAFNDTWQPFFHRNVTAVDTTSQPTRIYLDVPLRYRAQTRDQASIKKVSGYLEQVGVEELSLGNATDWATAWSLMQVHVLNMIGVKDAWVDRVASFNPPSSPGSGNGKDDHLQNSGLMVKLSKRVTVSDSHLSYAQNRGGGGCGYLFEIRQSSEVLFRDCVGIAGRHNFIQNWGFGASGNVWLRVHSSEGKNVVSEAWNLGATAYSEFHHSLSMANLIDASVSEDGWSAINRGDWSSGAGHSATQSVFWNHLGPGKIRSLQFGWGYVIGTHWDTEVATSLTLFNSGGTEPEDFTEGLGEALTLWPQSLYDDQLARRLEGGP